MKKIKEFLKENYIFIVILVVFYLINTIKLDYQIYTYGGLIDLMPRINISDSYNESGTFNLTYVTSRDGTLFNLFFSYIIPSWDRVSIDNSRIGDEDADEIFTRNQILLKETSYDAVIAAFDAAGLDYNVSNIDCVITYVFDEANTDLKTGDIIKSINGTDITSKDDILNIVKDYKENDELSFKVIRDDKEKECYAKLYVQDDRLLIGISISELKTVDTDPKVSFVFKDNESGSSRGLMCALEIYNRITEYDLTKGLVISGTGTIDDDGVVGEIAGVKYKLKGAVKNKADVFIVPEANYDEAIKLKNENNYDIKIIKAINLEQVIEELKNI